MKTIQVSDELFDTLKEIAQAVATQSNRGTATPYLFQIQTDEKVWVPNLNGDHQVIVSLDDHTEVGPFDHKTVAKLAKENGVKRPDWYKDLRTGWSVYESDSEEWLEKVGCLRDSYSIKHKYQNAFFTEAGCKAHIKANHYHYDNPRDYLNHAFRNPEMAAVFALLAAINEQVSQPQTP
ncbi:hypothetical protein [Spirosoma sordidisoli]|uniref:Uncharacterized protein n=1 Tax=Spirosoma sordidisoli TaxID=2502893 RepID=A0A4Q2ULR4_9BACT|nr:hypothetical protein [Spirosoma sordidisoli]RYC69672.1 hypothetical protein EQG79_13810 [Spirosoma sordidisoli]